MTPYPAQDAEAIRRGYEQYAPPPVPPGMYFDRGSWLILPEDTRPARIGQVIAAYALAVVLFKRAIGPDLLGMATGEALAHLNCLIHRGQAVRESDARGVHWYRAV